MAEQVKSYKTYDEQVDLLLRRGMLIGDRAVAAKTLARVNYYRLSGYRYPFRVECEDGRADDFYPGTRFDDVVALYEFDAKLRGATFEALMPNRLDAGPGDLLPDVVAAYPDVPAIPITHMGAPGEWRGSSRLWNGGQSPEA